MTLLMEQTQYWMKDVIFLLPNWKWIAAVSGFFLGFVVQATSRSILKLVKKHLLLSKRFALSSRKFISFWLLNDVHVPLSWLLAATIWHLTIQLLNVTDKFEHFLVLGVHILVLINLFRLAYMAVDALGMTLEDWAKNSKDNLDAQLAPFLTKVSKIFVITMGFLLSLQSLGFNVGAILAGLGIGSLALALAAQDTAANLFGSITIILDRPFQRGDSIKIGDTEGVIEDVGFRSTRIRTYYKSIITIPNATMAKERVDNLSRRPSRRLQHVLNISLQTPPALVQEFIATLVQYLSAHPHLDPKDITVNLQALGDFSMKILISCFILTADGEVEMATQQEVLLQILQIAQKMRVELPYPTQNINTQSVSNAVVAS